MCIRLHWVELHVSALYVGHLPAVIYTDDLGNLTYRAAIQDVLGVLSVCMMSAVRWGERDLVVSVVGIMT